MPPAWTNPPTWSADMPISVTKLNNLIGANGDLDYLKLASPVQQFYLVPASISTTGATFIDADATNLKVVITPRISRVKVTMIFSGMAAGSCIGLYDIYSVGLAARGGDTTWGLGNAYVLNAYMPIAISHIFSGLAAGVPQEFRLQFASSVAGQTAKVSNQPFTAIAEEVLP